MAGADNNSCFVPAPSGPWDDPNWKGDEEDDDVIEFTKPSVGKPAAPASSTPPLVVQQQQRAPQTTGVKESGKTVGEKQLQPALSPPAAASQPNAQPGGVTQQVALARQGIQQPPAYKPMVQQTAQPTKQPLPAATPCVFGQPSGQPVNCQPPQRQPMQQGAQQQTNTAGQPIRHRFQPQVPPPTSGAMQGHPRPQYVPQQPGGQPHIQAPPRPPYIPAQQSPFQQRPKQPHPQPQQYCQPTPFNPLPVNPKFASTQAYKQPTPNAIIPKYVQPLPSFPPTKPEEIKQQRWVPPGTAQTPPSSNFNFQSTPLTANFSPQPVMMTTSKNEPQKPIFAEPVLAVTKEEPQKHQSPPPGAEQQTYQSGSFGRVYKTGGNNNPSTTPTPPAAAAKNEEQKPAAANKQFFNFLGRR